VLGHGALPLAVLRRSVVADLGLPAAAAVSDN
jgi:hypothetical protein